MVKLILIAVCVLAVLPVVAEEKIDVWLDVDVGAGMPGRDVDDALMMIQAFNSPELNVRGVSCVYGNAPHDHGYPMAKEIAKEFGRPGLMVFPGAPNKKELGLPNLAVRNMAIALSEKPMHIMAVGPLTNVATLVKNGVAVRDRILSIVIVAGRRPGQHFAATPESTSYFPDFNFENDPEAMQILLDSDLKIVMAPWEVSSHVWIRQADLDALSEASESGAWIAETSKSWIATWKQNNNVDGFNPFDTLAIGWMTHPELIEHMYVTARIEEGADDLAPAASGRKKSYLLVEKTDEPSRLIYCYKPAPEFKEILMKRLAGPPN